MHVTLYCAEDLDGLRPVGEPIWHGQLGDFLEANADGIDRAEARAISTSLAMDGFHRFGGGAAAESVLVTDLLVQHGCRS